MERFYLHVEEKHHSVRKLIFSTNLPTEHFWHHVWVFHNKQILQFLMDTHWPSYELISSDNNYPELAQTPQVKGSFPQDCLTTSHPLQASIMSPTRLCLYFWPTSHKSESPQVQSFARRAPRIQENSPFTRLLVCDKKDTVQEHRWKA